MKPACPYFPVIHLVFLLCAGMSAAFGQDKARDTLHLVNGEVLTGMAAEDSGGYYRVLVSQGRRSGLVAVNRLDIYKITDRDGKERMLYQRDSSDALSFTAEQMWDFILGCRAAQRDYVPVAPMIAGGLVGGASAFAGFWGLAAPPAYLALLGLKRPGPGRSVSLPSAVTDPEVFELGYRVTAQRQKIRRTALTTLGGLVCVWILKVATTGLK